MYRVWSLDVSAMLTTTVRCVKLLVRGKVLLVGVIVYVSLVRSLLLAWNEQLLQLELLAVTWVKQKENYYFAGRTDLMLIL